MPLPHFIVIGAAKCGTTSLRRYLDQHPDIFMAPWGEPSFFAHEGAVQPVSHGPGDDEWCFVTDRGSYEDLFEAAEPGQRRGEVSPRYLYFEQSAPTMRSYVPDVRVVAILRQPVERAHSHFLMNRSRGCEPEGSFARALRREPERAARGWGWDWNYVSAGRYAEQLARYFDHFPADQIRVYLYEDLQDEGDRFFADLFSFLGVDASVLPDTSRRDRVAAAPRSHAVPQLLRGEHGVATIVKRAVPAPTRRRLKQQLLSLNSSSRPTLAATERRALTAEHFEDDITALEAMIGRDLHAWR